MDDNWYKKEWYDISWLNNKVKELLDKEGIDFSNYIVIDKISLEIHTDAINELAALKDFGVDNWSGYEEAMKSLEDNK